MAWVAVEGNGFEIICDGKPTCSWNKTWSYLEEECIDYECGDIEKSIYIPKGRM